MPVDIEIPITDIEEEAERARRELTGLIQTVEGLPELPTVWTL